MSSRLILILFLFLGFSTLGHSQLKLGAKISYTFSFVNLSEQLYDNTDNFVIYRLALTRQQVFPSIGAVAYYEFTNSFTNRNLSAFLQLESLFNYRRTHFEFENYLSSENPVEDFRKASYFIRFPLMGGLEYRQFKFGIGPIFSFLLHDNIVFDSYPNIAENYRIFEPAASVLAGAMFGDMTLDISYEYHFNGVSEFIYYRNQVKGFKQQPHYLSINVSYLFPYKPRRF